MSARDSRAGLASLSGPLPVADLEDLEAREDEIRPRLRQLVRELPVARRKQRARRRARAGAMLSGGVLAAAALWLLYPGPTEAFTVEFGTVHHLEGSENGFATAPSQAALIRSRGGSSIEVTGGTHVEAVSSKGAREQVVLRSGSLQIRVPHLPSGSSFAVRTPDALVLVHGTAFRVEVREEPGGETTCVEVSEGLVSVENHGQRVLLGPGKRFHCDEPSAAATPDERAAPQAQAEPTARFQGAQAPRKPVAPSARPASLAEQNRLLTAALRAEQEGRYREAEEPLKVLLERYPNSALRPEAERSLARIRSKAR